MKAFMTAMIFFICGCGRSPVESKLHKDRGDTVSWHGSFLIESRHLTPLFDKKMYAFSQIDFFPRGSARFLFKDLDGKMTHKIMVSGVRAAENEVTLFCDFISSYLNDGHPEYRKKENIYLKKRDKDGEFLGSFKKSAALQRSFVHRLHEGETSLALLPESLRRCSSSPIRVVRSLSKNQVRLELEDASKKYSFVEPSSIDFVGLAKTFPQGPYRFISLKDYKPLSESWVFDNFSNTVLPISGLSHFYVLPRVALPKSMVDLGNGDYRFEVGFTKNTGVTRKYGVWTEPKLIRVRVIRVESETTAIELAKVEGENLSAETKGSWGFNILKNVRTPKDSLKLVLDFTKEADELPFSVELPFDLENLAITSAAIPSVMRKAE